MPEAISIEALLRLQTKQADADLKTFAKRSKPLELRIRYKADDVAKSFADITSVAISSSIKTSFGTIGDDLVKKIEEAFSSAKVKSKGGGIFGGITDIVTAPLQGLARGAFEGVGREVSQKFGKGLSKGIEAEISQFLGSSEFLGEKLVTKIVPDLGKSAIAQIKATSLGKQLSDAMSDLDVSAARENLQQRFRDLLGDSDLLIEQEFQKSQNKKTKGQKLNTAKKEVASQLQRELQQQPQTELRDRGLASQIEALQKQSQRERNQLQKIATTAPTSPANIKQIEALINNLDARKKEIEKLQQEQQKLFKPEAQQKLARLGVNVGSVTGVVQAVDRATAANKKALAEFDKAEVNVKKDLAFINAQLPKQEQNLAELQSLAKEALKQNNIPLARAIAAKIANTKKNIDFLKTKLLEITSNLDKINAKQSELTKDINSSRDQKLVLALQQQIEIIQQLTGKSAEQISQAIATGQQKTLNSVIENARKNAQKNIKVIKSAIAKGSTVSESSIAQGKSEIAKTALNRLIKRRKAVETSIAQLLDEKAKLTSRKEKGIDVDDLIESVDSRINFKISQLTKIKASLQKAEQQNIADYQKNQEIIISENILETANRASQGLKAATEAVERIERRGDLEFERLNARLEQIVIKTREIVKTVEKATATTTQNNTKGAISPAQQLINQIAKEVERISGVAFDNIPQVQINPNLPKDLTGAFNNKQNVIKLTPDAVSNLETGEINDKLVEVIAHELRHAIQFQLAQALGGIDRLIRSGKLIQSKDEESKIISKFVELSAKNARGNLTRKQIEALEEDAYTWAYRYTDEIRRNIGLVQSKELTRIKSDLEKQLDSIKPPQLPKTPAISSANFPQVSQSAELEKLLAEQVSADRLKEIVKRLGLGTDSPVKKVAIERIVNSYKNDALKVIEVIGRLGDDIKLNNAKTGAGSSLGKIDREKELIESFKANRRALDEAYQQLETLSGEQREQLQKQARAVALEQIETIDRITREFKLAGKTGQSLSGTRSQFTAIYDRFARSSNTTQNSSLFDQASTASASSELYSAGTPGSDRTAQIVNRIAEAVEAEIADTVIKTIDNIIKSPKGRDLSKEVTVNSVGLVAGKSASIASGGILGNIAAETAKFSGANVPLIGAATAIATRKKIIQELDLENLIPQVVAGLAGGVNDNLNRVSVSGQRLAEQLLEGFRDRLGIRSPSKKMMEQMEYVVAGIAQSQTEKKQLLEKIGRNLAAYIEDGFEELSLEDKIEVQDLIRRDKFDLGARPTKAYKDALEKDLAEIEQGLSYWERIENQHIMKRETAKAESIALRRRMHFGLEEPSFSFIANSKSNQIANQTNSQLDSFVDSTTQAANKASLELYDIERKLKHQIADLQEATQDAGSRASRAKRQLNSGLNYSATEILAGVEKGVIGSLPDIEKQGSKIGDRLLQGFRDRLGIRSPSEEFFKDIKFVALGIAIGAEHHIKTTFKAGKKLGDELAVGFAKSNIAQGKIADSAAKQVEKQVSRLERANDRTTNATQKRIQQNLKRVNQVVEQENRKLDRAERQNEIAEARRIAQTQTRIFNNRGIGSAPIIAPDRELQSSLTRDLKTAVASIVNDLRNSGLEEANKEAQKVVSSTKDLLANLNVTVTVGQDAGTKIRASNSAIVRLKREQSLVIQGIDELASADRLAVQAQVERIQAQIQEEQERVSGLKAQQAEARKLLPVYRQLTQLNEELARAIANQDTRQIRRLNNEINEIHRSLNQPPPTNNRSFLERLNQQLERVGITSQRIKTALISLAAVAIGSIFAGDFTDVIRDVNEVTVRFEQLESQIDFAAGSAKQGAKKFALVRAEAKRLRVDIEETAKGYASLSAAVKNSEKLKDETNEIFRVINQSSRVTGATAQQTEAAFLAIQQMVSGGTLQLEELRQLGESGGIGGVFDIAQKALGAASGELKKLISTGTIAVDNFLPKFIKQLDLATRSGVSDALKTTAAAITNVKNEYKLLQVEIGKSTQSATKTALNAIAASLELVRNNLDIILPVVKTTALLLSVALLPTVVSLAKVVGGFLVTGLGQVLSLLVPINTQLLATNIQLQLIASTSPRIALLIAHLNKMLIVTKLLGTAFLALGAVVVVQQFAEAFINTRRAGLEARDAVNEINDAVIELKKTLADIDQEELLPENLTKQIVDENKKALLKEQNFAQKAVDGVINRIPTRLNKVIAKGSLLSLFGVKELSTYSDAAVSRIQAATGDVISANQQLLQSADNKLGVGDLTDKATDELQFFADALTFTNQSLQKTLNASVDPNQIDRLNAELTENQKRIERYNAELARREGLELNLARIIIAKNETVEAATKAELDALTAIDEEIIKSGDYKKDVELQKLQYAQTRIDAELKAEKLAREKILELAKDTAGIDPKTGKPKQAQQLEEFEKTEKRIIQLTRSSIETRQSLLAKEVEQNLAEYDRFLEKVEGRRQKAEEKAIQFEKQRLIQIQKLVNDDLINTETAEDLKSDLTRDRITEDLKQEKKKLRQLKRFKSSEVEVQEKRDEDIKASKTKVLGLTLQLLEQEKQAEEKAIAAISQARDNYYSKIEGNLNRLQQIQQTEAQLTRDRTDSIEKLGNLEVVKLRQALELRKQLNSGELNTDERRTTLRQLYSLGIDGRTDELGLLKQIEDKEKAIAEEKIANLLVQQEFAREQLAIENELLRISTAKDVNQAQKNQIDAQKQVLGAEQALLAADTTDEVEQANKILTLAEESLQLANDEVDLAEQQADKLDDIVERKKRNLELIQAIARAELKDTTVNEEFDRQREKNTLKEAKSFRQRRDGKNVDIERYLSRQEKIDGLIEDERDQKGEEFTEKDEAKLRARLNRQFNRNEDRQEKGVRKSIRGSSFTIDAPPEILEAIASGKPFLIPAVPSVKSTVPLQTETIKTKDGLNEDSMILKTLKNIETKFKQPTVIQVQNDNNFTNVYERSSSDEVPRIVRSEMIDMLNTLESELNEF